MNYKKVIFLEIVIISLFLILSSCRTIAGQPVIKNAEIIPSELTPGSSAVIQVVVKDKHHVVRKVEGFVKEDPRIKLKLRDDGVEPDKKANDGIWVLKVDVPNEAVPGKFTLEVDAYNKDGMPVKIRDKGEVFPLHLEIPIVIK